MYLNFKTSYVTVYPGSFYLVPINISHFKTSYVTVYLCASLRCLIIIPISKHRMLLFISIREICLLHGRISKHRMLLFIHYHQPHDRSHSNFKTSYVTVYRVMRCLKCGEIRFQNIVCYCLSLMDIGDRMS